eukprot:m.225864 g.225864  ORF g.225864 m.225864 type:complete len:156 (+) comp15961_c1_seq10:147-614(+)
MRWLRVVGVDVAVADSNDDLESLLQMAEREQRVILSKNGKFHRQRGGEGCYFLNGNDTKSQFREVATHFGIKWNDERFLTICAKCNARGFKGPMSLEEARKICGENAIKERVAAQVTEFWVCNNTDCKQIYWVRQYFSYRWAQNMRMRTKNSETC